MNLSVKDELIYVFETDEKLKFFYFWSLKLQNWIFELFLLFLEIW